MANARLPVMLAAVGLAALTLTAPATTGAGGYWIVLASDRDGQTRGYSVRPDGTRLSPLLPLTRALVPADISADGRVVVHHELYEGGAYVSRANGTGFHRVPGGRIVSRDGKLLAFARLYEKDKRKNGIWVVGADGRGLRHIASNRELDLEDWSPDGKALLLIASGDDRSRLIVQPLHGTARVIARGPDFGDAAWSPSGRWIAWSADRNGKDELDVVEPSGADRHRVLRGEPRAFAWSPNGSTLAVAFRQGPLTIVDADGRRLRRLPLTPSLAVASELRWSPDGRLLAVKPDFRSDIWVIGVDGHGLRQVTKGGTNDIVGWTGPAPGGSTARGSSSHVPQCSRSTTSRRESRSCSDRCPPATGSRTSTAESRCFERTTRSCSCGSTTAARSRSRRVVVTGSPSSRRPASTTRTRRPRARVASSSCPGRTSSVDC